MKFLITLLASIIVNNVVLMGYKGLCSYVGISNKWSSSVGMGAALTLVCFVSGLLCWGIQFALNALGIAYLQTVVFILVVASLVQMLEIVMKKFLPGLYKALGIYLPLITTNCVVLGLALQVAAYADSASNIDTVLGLCLGMPLGYYIVLLVFSGVQEKLAIGEPYKTFKGPAMAFITTAFMALAMSGFSGLINEDEANSLPVFEKVTLWTVVGLFIVGAVVYLALKAKKKPTE